jgi:hypothetical protein
MYESFPKDPELLKNLIISELDLIALREPGKINRVETRFPKTQEVSFSAKEVPIAIPKLQIRPAQGVRSTIKSSDAHRDSANCDICGYKGHKQDSCLYKQPGKSLSENQAYARAENLRRRKERESRGTSAAGPVKSPPAYSWKYNLTLSKWPGANPY